MAPDPAPPPAPERSLEELRRRFVEESDEGAMEELVRRTRPRLLGAARRIGSPQDAEDSVQAGFHSLLRKGREPLSGPVEAWLLTAVVRLAYRRKAVLRRQEDLARRLGPANPVPDPPSRLTAEEESALLRRTLLRLPPPYRDAIVLHHLQGLPVADVAALLDAPVSTVKARLRRGRALLRSRLPVSLHLAFAVVPWAAGDAWRSLSSAARVTAGGAMKAKTVAAVMLLAVAVIGGTAWSLLAPESRAPVSRRAPEGTPISPRSAEEVAAGSAPRSGPEHGLSPAPVPGSGTVEPAATERSPGRATATPPLPARPGGLRAEDTAGVPVGSRFIDQPIPDALRTSAAAAGVPEAALAAAWTAYLSGKANRARGPFGIVDQPALDGLKAMGPEGFKAVVALLQGGNDGTWFRDLVGACWSPGLEPGLFAASESAALTPSVRWSALDSLGVADSAATRDYLVARLASEKDPYLAWGAVRALVVLREPRGAEPLSRRLEDRLAGDVIRRSFLSSMGEMDPAVARRVLVERLALPDADLLVDTVQSLRRVDEEAARREAGTLLDGSRAAGLNPREVSILRAIAGRTDSK